MSTVFFNKMNQKASKIKLGTAIIQNSLLFHKIKSFLPFSTSGVKLALLKIKLNSLVKNEADISSDSSSKKITQKSKALTLHIESHPNKENIFPNGTFEPMKFMDSPPNENKIISHVINEILSSAYSPKKKEKTIVKFKHEIEPEAFQSSLQLNKYSYMLSPPQKEKAPKHFPLNQVNNSYNTDKKKIQEEIKITPFELKGIEPEKEDEKTHETSSSESNYEVDFITKLSSDLFSSATKTEINNYLLFNVKQNVIKLIKEIIEKTFSEEIENKISLDLYGSFASGSAIESSDLDLLIKFVYKEDITIPLLELLSTSLQNSGEFSQVFPISSAKVPVIKLEFALNPNEETVKDIIAKTNVTIIKIDITFRNIFYSSFVPAIEAVKYIKGSIGFFPISKCLIFFLKKFLSKKKLHSYYYGGLSSYSIFILVFALIKMDKSYLKYNQLNVGEMLIRFLEFYSLFNFDKFGVNLNYSCPFFPIQKYAMNNYDYNIPCIIDPITTLNIGGGTFKINEIKKCFAELIKDLKEKFKGYSKEEKNENLLEDFLKI